MLDVRGPSARLDDSSTPPSSRLVRASDMNLDATAPVATMYVSSRGGAIRRLVGMRHRHILGVRFDPQMHFGQPVEGVVEGAAMMRCATDPDVLFYQTQPFRIALMAGATLCSWTADIIYCTSDGVVWVREVKRTDSDLIKPDYVAKLEAVQRVLAGIGWKFKPWTREAILGNEARQVNTGVLYFDRAAELDSFMPRFEAIAAATEVTTFGDLISELDSRNTSRARAAVHRLIMRGRVWADLDRLLEDWSEVRLRSVPTVSWDLPFS